MTALGSLDCIEFGPKLRAGDVLADAAFLAMDLERLGRPDLGARFHASYREFNAGTWPESLALLLAKTHKDVEPLRVALDAAYAHLRSFRATPATTRTESSQ